MADAGMPRHAPRDWSTAFAALPLENAPADGWSRLAGAMPASAPAASTRLPRPRRRKAALALAACLAVAAVPVALKLAGETGAADVDPAHVARVAATVPPPPSASAARGSASPAVAASTAVDPPTATAQRVTSSTSVHDRPPRAAHATVSRPAAERVAASERAPSTPPVPAAGQPAIAADAAPTLARAELDALRDESARLEALVAYARDDVVASAPAAVMTAAVDDRLRLIDAALSQAGGEEAVLASLWRQRVEALQELAALEGTQRWLAVHGASMDTVARID